MSRGYNMSDKINTVQITPRLGDNYSDVTIIFSDLRSSIAMKLHRVFLAWIVPYFDTLFLFSENLKRDQFIVSVEDAEVAELFIKSLYGQEIDLLSNCYTFLHFCKLRSYFCLDLDLEQLYKFKIPAENFELFLQVVNLPEVELDRRLIGMIRMNTPKGYTWEGINEGFKEEVMKKNKYIVSGHRRGNIKIWDPELIKKRGLVSKGCVKTLTDHTNLITSIVVTEDRQQVISGSDEGAIKIWEISSGECVKTLTGHTDWVESVVITKDRQQIISASTDNTIKIWDISSGECVKTLTGHINSVCSIVITKDHQRIFSASADNTIKIWEISSGECVKTLTGHTDWVMSIDITEDQQQIVSAGADRTIRIWNIDTGKCVKTLTGHSFWVESVVVSKNQKQIFSASADRTIKIWDVSSGECVKTLTDTERFKKIIMTEDQQRIISASEDRTVKIWDIATGKCVKTFTCNEDDGRFFSLSLF